MPLTTALPIYLASLQYMAGLASVTHWNPPPLDSHCSLTSAHLFCSFAGSFCCLALEGPCPRGFSCMFFSISSYLSVVLVMNHKSLPLTPNDSRT